MSAWANILLNGGKMPDLSWTIDEKTGEITATISQRDAIVHEAKMWYGYSCGQNSWDGDKKRRDFRVAHLDYPCTCGIYAEGTCANLKSVLKQQVMSA